MATGRAARNALAAEAEPTDFVMARGQSDAIQCREKPGSLRRAAPRNDDTL
jgi:hypothetical protein